MKQPHPKDRGMEKLWIFTTLRLPDSCSLGYLKNLLLQGHRFAMLALFYPFFRRKVSGILGKARQKSIHKVVHKLLKWNKFFTYHKFLSVTGRDAPENYCVKTISVLSTQVAHPGIWEAFSSTRSLYPKKGWWKRGKRLAHFNLAHAEYLPFNCQLLLLPPLSFCGHQMFHHILPIEFLSEFSRFLLCILKPNTINTHLTRGGGEIINFSCFWWTSSTKQKLFCFWPLERVVTQGNKKRPGLEQLSKTNPMEHRRAYLRHGWNYSLARDWKKFPYVFPFPWPM